MAGRTTASEVQPIPVAVEASFNMVISNFYAKLLGKFFRLFPSRNLHLHEFNAAAVIRVVAFGVSNFVQELKSALFLLELLGVEVDGFFFG